MMTLFRTWLCAALALTLSACIGASHIPPPWEIPGAVIGTTIGNARYEARRKKVKIYLADHYDIILVQLNSGDGKNVHEAYSLANVPAAEFTKLTQELSTNPEIYLNGPPEQNIERITVAIMVHGG